MTEKELIEIMYQKHHKWLLSAKEAAVEWGSSYSALNKLFGGADAISEKIILERKIIPVWTLFGHKRMWKLTNIAKWLLETDSKGEIL